MLLGTASEQFATRTLRGLRSPRRPTTNGERAEKSTQNSGKAPWEGRRGSFDREERSEPPQGPRQGHGSNLGAPGTGFPFADTE
nr:MAG: hypothetical protein DIU78_16010 [Pseudomonadota bacterium]